MLEIKFTKDEGIPDPYIEMGNSGFETDYEVTWVTLLDLHKQTV